MILPSSWCAINVMIQTHINVVGLSIIPSIAAGANDNHEPKKGIKLRHQQIELIKEYMVSQ